MMTWFRRLFCRHDSPVLDVATFLAAHHVGILARWLE